MKVVPLPDRSAEAVERLVTALEAVLELARAGKIQACVFIGMDDRSQETHRFHHRANSPEMIGAMFLFATKICHGWNEGALYAGDDSTEPPAA